MGGDEEVTWKMMGEDKEVNMEDDEETKKLTWKMMERRRSSLEDD